MNNPKLSIIVVNYNTSMLLNNCLSSIYKNSSREIKNKIEIIVVDNNSTDDSKNILKEYFPQLKLISNDENLGFAAGNNQGIKVAKGKFVLLLNTDTQIKPDFFDKLIGFAQTNDAAVIGVRLLNKDGTQQSSAGYFPNLSRVFYWMFFIDDIPVISKLILAYHMDRKEFYDRIQNVDWTTGACFLFKKDIITKSGVFDENIFMYGEEVEWCYRIKKAGFSILYSPDVSVYHMKGASGIGKYSGIVDEFRSLIYFYRKHKPYWQLFLLRIFLISGALLRMIFFGIIGRNPKRFFFYAKAFAVAGR